MTLLALTDANKVFTFQLRKEFSAEETVTAVADLYRMGALEECGGRLKPTGSYRDMIDTLKQVERVIALQVEEGHRSQILLYPRKDDRVVVLESSCGYERAVKLSCREWSELLEELRENEILPHSVVKDRAEAVQLERMAGEVAGEQGRVLIKCLVVEPASGTTVETWEVVSAAAMRLLKVSGSREYTHIYAADELTALLEETWKGETSGSL